jgi:hypothetical protein
LRHQFDSRLLLRPARPRRPTVRPGGPGGPGPGPTGRRLKMAVINRSLSRLLIAILGVILVLSDDVESFIMTPNFASAVLPLRRGPIDFAQARRVSRIGMMRALRMSLDAPSVSSLLSVDMQATATYALSKLSSLTYEEIAGGLFGASLFPVRWLDDCKNDLEPS